MKNRRIYYASCKKPFKAIIILLGRERSAMQQKLSTASAVFAWMKWLFLPLRLCGSISAFVAVALGISSDMYLQYSCLVGWEVSDFTFAVKVVAGIGDELKAAFLTILNRPSARRVLLGAFSLSSTPTFRVL